MVTLKVNKNTVSDDLSLDLQSFVKSNNDYRIDEGFNIYVFNNDTKLFELKGEYKEYLKHIYSSRYVNKDSFIYSTSIKTLNDGTTAEIKNQISPADKMSRVLSTITDYDIRQLIKPLNPSKGIAVNNKFIYLNDGNVTVEDLDNKHEQITKSNIDYDSDSKSPIWNKFLDSVFDGDSDKNEKITYIQNYLGACLFGQATKTEKALIFFGAGANGKSVLVDTISKIFNRKSTNVSIGLISSMLDSGKGTREYSRSYLNIDTDTSPKALDDTSTLKKVITGDVIEAKQLYRADTFEFAPVAGNIFNMNEFPYLRDSSNGTNRRLTIISFNNEFNGEKRDNLLSDKLSNELPGILNWLIEGGKNIVELNFKQKDLDSSNEELEEVKSINPMEQFLSNLKPSRQAITLTDLYNDYFKFYKKTTGKESNNVYKAFSRALKNKKIESKKTNKGVVFYCSIYNSNAINASEDLIEDILSKIEMN